MAAYDLRFPHKLGAAEARLRVETELRKLATDHGLVSQNSAENQYRLFGKGVDARVSVTDNEVRIALELSLLVDMLAGPRIRKALQDGLPGVLA